MAPSTRRSHRAAQLSVLAVVAVVCTVALLLAPPAEARPTKEDLIVTMKNARDAFSNPKLNGRYKATTLFLDHIIPQMETDWNPTEGFLDEVNGKTLLMPDDVTLAAAAPDVLYDMVRPTLKPRDVESQYMPLIRANLLDGVYEEEDIKAAKVLKDANGRVVGKVEVEESSQKKVAIGNAKAKVKHPAIFRGKLGIVHGVDAVQAVS
ncbi:unnamed protein product [Closterium sp. Yama58-4]|nr:unnamed protein product [Closterium sp. Yama58-4]